MVGRKTAKRVASDLQTGLIPRISPTSSRRAPTVRLGAKSSGRVGQRGELFPPKQVRDEAGLRPGDVVTYTADHGRLGIVKVPGLREAFLRRKTAKIMAEEFEKMTQESLSQ
jgi:bifunctional DNA-binding transcriptional regulator/antitoxin component of YhaV-PrlF toxin-antitoxin module